MTSPAGFLPVLRRQNSNWEDINSERVLQVLVNNLDGMVFRCAIDEQWTLHFVSQGCSDLIGYCPDELEFNKVTTLESLTHPDDSFRVRQVITEASKGGGRYRVQYRLRHRDVGEKWVLERGAVVRDEMGDRVLEGFIEDITEQVASQRLLADAEMRYRSIFEDSVIGMFQTSIDGRYLAANRALAALYGYESPAALIAGLSEIATRLYVNPERRKQFKQRIRETGRVADFVSEVYCRDGSHIWIAENAHVVFGSDGEALYYEGTVEDVTTQHNYRRQLEYQATHDPLTGLPNRNLLEDRLQQALHMAQRKAGRCTLAFVDLDNFKLVNDSLGHGAGDRLLVETARRLKSCLRDTDTVARYGGDEFVLILGDDAGLSDTLHILYRIQECIAEPIMLEEQEIRVNCSIGVSVFPDDGEDLESLLRHADAAMHHAKQLGKGQFQFYTESLNAAARERLALDSALRRAVDQEELYVVYQPKVDARGRACGFEALVRWDSEDFGSVSPVKFVPIAEENGLIGRLTWFVLHAACREAAGWRAKGYKSLRVAVNISPSLFREKDLGALVRSVLEEAGLPPENLELEITEGMLMGDVQRALAVLNELKAMGVHIAIDDFGTGYSSLAYLKRFPIDILKVDRSFVMECDAGAEATAITRAIVSLAHSLNLRVVAEGVERPSQLAEAGVPLIEVTHGDGLGGSSVNYGFPAHSDEEYLGAVIPRMKKAKVSALLLPGIGTVDHLKMARNLGVNTIRVATHCTEADVSEQHITMARKLDMDTVGFLMMSHMNNADGLVKQARLMEGYGANCIYVTDSAGHLLPEGVKERLGAVRQALMPETELGFHGHHNLAMGVANSIAAIEVGANRIDAAAAGLGAGAGNTPMEVLIAVCTLMGIETGVNVAKITDVAEDLVVPMMDFPIRIDRDALTLGYAGVYGSFLLFAKRASVKYGVPARDILVELGRRGMVGGQEDMIEDTAMTLARERGLAI